jgi:hypothetical protein
MKVYPYSRDDAVVERIALRLAGSENTWDPAEDRLDLAPPENGEPIRIEVKIDVDVPTVLSRPLVPPSQPLTIVAVARCSETRWAEVVGRWEVPLRNRPPITSRFHAGSGIAR